MKTQLPKVKKTINGPVINRLMKKRSLKITVLVPAVILLASILCYFIFFSPRPCRYEYTIEPLQEPDKGLEVNIAIKNEGREDKIKLYKRDIAYSGTRCINAENRRNIEFEEKDDFIEIAAGGAKDILFSYQAELGRLDKHGHKGGIYSDLVVFSGEEVFLLPEYAFSTDDALIKRKIKDISVHYHIPEDWVSVIPFPKTAGSEEFTQLSRPTWADLYDFSKSCFAFGAFGQHTYDKGKGKLQVLIDPACKINYTGETEEGLNSIYRYYSGLFNTSIDFTLLLLREDAGDNLYIIGGASTQTGGSTFDPQEARDWQLMGHRFFHAFFDTAIRKTTFHMPPQLWFYEGMATYYENMSMNSLPESIRRKTGLSSEGGFLKLYEQYLYMRLKDKYLYNTAPMDEKKLSPLKGITEFLHYTEAPLIIKALEDIGYAGYGQHDRILNYILSGGKEVLSVDQLVRYAVGDRSDSFLNNYMYRSELLPMWYLGENKIEEPGRILQSLNDIEYTQWTWLKLLDPAYPLDTLSDKGLDLLAAEAEKNSVHFADEVLESNIRKLSPTLYSLLQQYYLRAKICGEAPDNKMLRYELLGEKEKQAQWDAYLEKLKIK